MDSNVKRVQVDWMSRMLAIVSLAVALGAVAFLYAQSQIAGTTRDLESQFQAKLDAMMKQYEATQSQLESNYRAVLQQHESRMTDWNGKLVTALDDFTLDARNLMDDMRRDEEQAREQRLLVMRQHFPEVFGKAETAVAQDDQTSDQAAPAASQLAGSFDSATLTLAQSSLRPGDTNTTLIRIDNHSAEEAIVSRIRFKPESDFTIGEPEDFSLLADAEQVTTVAYNALDNTSTKSGEHGIYDRTLSTPIRVPAGESLTLRIVIDNARYKKYGFTGQLVVDYNNSDPLVVKDARVHFRDVDATTET